MVRSWTLHLNLHLKACTAFPNRIVINFNDVFLGDPSNPILVAQM